MYYLKSLITVFFISVLVVGCSNNLDNEKAKKILLEKEFDKPYVECSWVQPSQSTASTYTYSTYIYEIEMCARQLQKEGLVELGYCKSRGCTGGCCSRSIMATTNSRMDGILKFSCGDYRFLKITSIFTEGNKATVKYDREIKLDTKRLNSLSSCILSKPEGGIKERERQFIRDDAGNWHMR